MKNSLESFPVPIEKIQSEVIELANNSGLELVGFAEAELSNQDRANIESFIQKKYYASMKWFPERQNIRMDFENLGFKPNTVIALGMIYKPRSKDLDDLKEISNEISSYAWGEDYHQVLKSKAKPILKFLREKFPNKKFRQGVDSLPLPEKILARNAGLGWIGKNTLLIHPKLGSYFFISLILCEVELHLTDNLSINNISIEIKNASDPSTNIISLENKNADDLSTNNISIENNNTNDPSTNNISIENNNANDLSTNNVSIENIITNDLSTNNLSLENKNADDLSTNNESKIDSTYLFKKSFINDENLLSQDKQSQEKITNHITNFSKDRCGSCTACIDACPTHAIFAPYQMDANLCISHHTIEYKANEFPDSIQTKGWVYGCDICQEVCPWNRVVATKQGVETKVREFYPLPIFKKGKEVLYSMDEDTFKKELEKSAIIRIGFKNWRRNIQKKGMENPFPLKSQ